MPTTANAEPQPWVELRILLEKDNATVKYLSERTGLSGRYLYDLLAGTRRPTPRAIAALADAMNVPKSMLEPRAAA